MQAGALGGGFLLPPALGGGEEGSRASGLGTEPRRQRAEEMEGDGVRWGSEPLSGPGPGGGGGGGGMIRDLCRSFGRYRRYLGRLRQNLRETQKFFRDLQGSHSHSCPSSPTETGLQAGKEGSR